MRAREIWILCVRRPTRRPEDPHRAHLRRQSGNIGRIAPRVDAVWPSVAASHATGLAACRALAPASARCLDTHDLRTPLHIEDEALSHDQSARAHGSSDALPNGGSHPSTPHSSTSTSKRLSQRSGRGRRCLWRRYVIRVDCLSCTRSVWAALQPMSTLCWAQAAAAVGDARSGWEFEWSTGL